MKQASENEWKNSIHEALRQRHQHNYKTEEMTTSEIAPSTSAATVAIMRWTVAIAATATHDNLIIDHI